MTFGAGSCNVVEDRETAAKYEGTKANHGEQQGWNHKMANVLDSVPKREQAEAKRLLRKVAYAPTRGGGRRRAQGL